MTTPNQGGQPAPQPGRPTTPPPVAPPPSRPATPAPGQQPPVGAPNTPPPVAASAGGQDANPLAGLMANRNALIAGGVALAALVIGGGYFIFGGSSAEKVTGTQQLTATNPGANQNSQALGVPDGFKPPAKDATGRIIDTPELAVDRESTEVTIAKVDPSTYAQIGEWWARANDKGDLYLPPGKTVADVTFFSGDDQTAPYTGQATEEKGAVTSVTFEKGISGGFNLSPGAQVWYTDPSFQSDPAYILIPKGLEGTFQVFVGSLPIELAIP